MSSNELSEYLEELDKNDATQAPINEGDRQKRIVDAGKKAVVNQEGKKKVEEGAAIIAGEEATSHVGQRVDTLPQ